MLRGACSERAMSQDSFNHISNSFNHISKPNTSTLGEAPFLNSALRKPRATCASSLVEWRETQENIVTYPLVACEYKDSSYGFRSPEQSCVPFSTLDQLYL